METVCAVCRRVLTDNTGTRFASEIWDSSIGLGGLCSDCNTEVKMFKEMGDALLTSAITMEEIPIFSPEEDQEMAAQYYSGALEAYTLCFAHNKFRQRAAG